MKIVVTGMGVVSPLGNTIPAYWESLCAGRSGIRRIDRFDTEKYNCRIAGMAEDVAPACMDSKELRRHARCSIFGIEAARQALEQSGIDLNRENPLRCGVICGSGIGGLEIIYEGCVKHGTEGPRRVSPLMVPTGISNAPAGLLGKVFNFMGPNQAIVTACAAGSHAIGHAAELIRLGKADVMLAGGAEATVIPFGIGGFDAMKALSTKRNDTPEAASRPFDADRDGFVMGEGAGMLVLESEERARARGAEILGEVVTSGESCDAYHVAAPREDGSCVAAAMQAALDQGRVNRDEIGYVNAHGTSTKLNDAMESRALRIVFGAAMPPVSSTKSMHGHLLGAAGAIEAIACLLALRHGVLPPNINYETPDPECDVNVVANVAREAKVAAALSNSLGFGGHNVSLLLRRHG
jgi:3-oxoacyl-[acyl-carrier-protein] synthase II